MRHLTLALSEVFRSHGGIPRYNRLLLEASRRFAQSRGIGFTALSLNDLPGANASVRGFEGRRSAFAGAVLSGRGAVVLGHARFAGLAPALRLLRRPTAVMAHGTEIWERRSWLERAGLRSAKAIWAVSRYSADRLAQVQEIDRAKVALLPGALPGDLAERFLPRDTQHLASVPWVLSVTRLDASERYKGVDTCLHGLARLRNRLPEVRYEVIGEGSDLPRLTRLASELGISSLVTFRGRVTDEELLEAYRRAWVFALPSSGEGFGLVVLEAWAAGIPVVGARAAATPELVEDGVNGVLVPPGNEQVLAERLESLLLAPTHTREALAAAGRATLDARYRPEAFFAAADQRLESLFV